MPVDFQMDGPIPGENFTSDTKNYAWHRPPEHTTTDSAIEFISKSLMREEAMASAIFMMEMGIDIVTLTDIYLTKGISEGKWSVDLAILLAGPVAHIFVILAKGYDIPVNLGVKKNFNAPTPAFFNAMKKEKKKLEKDKTKAVREDVADMVTNQPMGFMAGMPEEGPMEPPMPEEEESMPMEGMM